MAHAERVRRIYNARARSYDAAAERAGLRALRGRLFARARGDVLELGVGAGATLGHYPEAVRRLVGLDVSEGMLALAAPRTAGQPFPVSLLQVDNQFLPFVADSFDTVASSLALCGIPEPLTLFSEIRRVLRPGGQLLALEHIRPPNPLLGLATDAVSPLTNYLVGCYFNRRTPELLRVAGFDVEVLERRVLGGLVALVAT